MKNKFTQWSKAIAMLPVLIMLQFVAFGQITVQVGSGTATNSYLPMYYLYGYNYTQTIYTAQELMGGGMYSSGEITKIRYKPTSNANTNNWKDWEVYIGNTTQTTFSSNTNWITVGNMTQVFDGVLPANVVSNTWMEINLTTSFVWDGTSNLVVAIREKTPGWGGSPSWSSYSATGSNRGIYYYNDNTNPNPASPPPASGRSNNLAQIQFEWESNLPLCTGSPVAGTIPSILEICPNEAFSINLTGAQLNSSGITGQWQSRELPAGTWTNIAGATAFSLSVPNGVGVETAYRFILTCTSSNMSDTTNALEIDFLPSNVCYCLPSTNSTTYFIDSFSTTGAIQNVVNGGTGMGPNGFQNFVATDTITQMQTQEVAFRIKGSSTSTAGAKIWVDWNQNGVFDTNEQVFVTSSYSNIHQGNFQVPMNATPGVTRLRVGWHGTSTSGPTGPCQTGMNGEFEDYAFKVMALPDCSNVTTPTTWNVVLDRDTLCVTGDVNLSVSEMIMASNVTYQFQQSPDGVTWTNIGTPNTTGEASVVGVSALTYFRVNWLCNNTEVATSEVKSVYITDPEITSTTGASRCGPGVVTLSAVATEGEIRWYDDALGTNLLSTGSNFVTPFLGNTTTFWVAAGSGGAGGGNDSLHTLGSGGNGCSGGAMFNLTPTSNLNIDSITALANGSGSVVKVYYREGGYVGFNQNAGAWTLHETINMSYTSGNIKIPLTSPIELDANTTYGIYVFFNASYTNSTAANSTHSNADLLFEGGDGLCNEFGGVNVGRIFNGTIHYSMPGCEGNLVAVDATINPASPITGNAHEVVCADDIVAITITAGVNDYPSITYTPTTNLYTDAQATVPYVLGTHATTLYFKSATPGEHSVYISGTNTITECNGVDTLNIFVQPGQPELLTLNDTICYGEDLEIELLPVGGYAPNSIQWQSSPDGITWTDIVGATTQELLVTNITESGFYRPQISSSTGLCTAVIKEITVSDPDIVAVQDGQTCGPGPVTMSATATTGPQIAWFDDINSTMPIHVGPDYTTPVLNQSTPYYVSAFVGGGESPDEFVGSGNNTMSSSPQPFHTLWWGSKNQYLIRADELIALGYSHGNITELIFDVIDASGGSMSNFEVKMGTTTLTALTSVFQIGLQSVYVGVAPETLVANTEKTFVLDNPFYWDGVSNLVIETCFNNTNWSSGHSVRGTTMTFNASTYQYGDNATVCTQPTGFTSTSRPNMKFKIDSGCRSDKTEVMAYVRPEVNLNLPNTLNLCTSPQNPGKLDAGTHPNNVTYLWDNNTTDRYRTVYQSGVYSVTVTNEFGCSATDTVDVTIRENPVVDLGGDTTLCLGGELELDAGPDGVVYTWSNGSLGRYTTINTPGTYTVLVEAANGCVVIDTIQVAFSNQEIASMDGIMVNSIAQKTFKFSAINPENVSNYFWSFGDGNYSTTPEPVHTYAQGGNYVVVLELSNDCGKITDSVSTHMVSIGDQDAASRSITVYPNPTKGNVTIKNTSEYRMLAVSISDATGRTLQQVDIDVVDEHFNKDIDLSKYADGMYWIHIHTEHGVFTKKINLIKH